MNSRTIRLGVLGLLLSGVTMGVGCASRPPARPNILLILADDMGYSDIGCYGGEVATPNLDRLAAAGLRFTQFYNNARCCPTRASLLTGLYPHQAGVGHMTENLGYEGYRGQLNDRCVTVAEVLRSAGYHTYMCGKWHVAWKNQPQPVLPGQRGFEHYYGAVFGNADYFHPGDPLRLDGQILETPPDFYYTDALSAAACRFLRDHAEQEGDRPFFLYLAYTAPHWPLQAQPADIAKYRDRYRTGWDVLRRERYERLLKLGLIDPRWLLSPRDPAAPAWETLSAAKKDDFALRMAVYAAQIDCLDQGVGRVLAALEKLGQLDNTLIFFLADNGGCAEGISRGDPNAPIGTPASFESYRLPWANASNTPFRLFKHYVHEGGIATPLIVHWPAGIHARGEFRHQPGHVIDLLPTCADVAGATYPKQYRGRDILPAEGVSLVPAFANQPLRRQALYWEHEGNRAVRADDWKLVARGKNGPWELYNLKDDRSEIRNCAAEQPARVRRLAELWQNWAQRCQVLPLVPRPGPRANRANAPAP